MSETKHEQPRLKTLDPELYDYVGPILPPEEVGFMIFWGEVDETFRKEMTANRSWARSHSDSWGKHGRCDLCGAWFKTGAIFKNRDTDRSLTVGHECEQTVFGFLCEKSRIAQELHRRYLKGKATQDRKEKAKKLFKDLDELFQTPHQIVWDIKHRFEATGKISEKQVKLLRDIGKREKAKQAQQEAEKVLLREVPQTEERVQVEGEVLGLRYPEFGDEEPVKMLVKVSVDGGFYKLWGTVPSSLLQDDKTLKGKRVKFMARVARSDRDASFGFFSRPTKAEVQ